MIEATKGPAILIVCSPDCNISILLVASNQVRGFVLSVICLVMILGDNQIVVWGTSERFGHTESKNLCTY
jgi:hypothetical protein